MDTTASSFTARKNAKRAAEKMIADGKAPAVDYGIRPRDDGRFEIVWKTAPTTGEVETEIATAASAAEGGHYSINPRLSVNEDPSDAPPSAGLKRPGATDFVNRDMTQRLVAAPLDFGGTPSMCVVVFNRRKRWTPLLLVSHCARTLTELRRLEQF